MWAFLYACVTPHVIPSEARDLQSAMFDSEITAACPRDTVRSISVQYACSFGNIFRSREQVAGRRALEDELSTDPRYQHLHLYCQTEAIECTAAFA